MQTLSPQVPHLYTQVCVFQSEHPRDSRMPHVCPTQLASFPAPLIARYHPDPSSFSFPYSLQSLLFLTVTFCGVCLLHMLQFVSLCHSTSPHLHRFPPPPPFITLTNGSASLPLTQFPPNSSWDQCSQTLSWDWTRITWGLTTCRVLHFSRTHQFPVARTRSWKSLFARLSKSENHPGLKKPE